jgi:hypothetical protein
MGKLIRFAIYGVIFFTIFKFVQENPSREEYNDWISGQVTGETQNLLIQSLVNIISEPVLNSSTTHTDYVLFSIYETDLSVIGMDKIKVIGILGQFIPLSNSSEPDYSDI